MLPRKYQNELDWESDIPISLKFIRGSTNIFMACKISIINAIFLTNKFENITLIPSK